METKQVLKLALLARGLRIPQKDAYMWVSSRLPKVNGDTCSREFLENPARLTVSDLWRIVDSVYLARDEAISPVAP